MTDNYPVRDYIEQTIASQTVALMGNNDINLNTIVKMSLISEIKPMDEAKVKQILDQISSTNKAEKYWIEREYMMTMDSGGNVVPVQNISNNNIDDKIESKEEGNSECVVPEST